jgi:hypothetical protein
MVKSFQGGVLVRSSSEGMVPATPAAVISAGFRRVSFHFVSGLSALPGKRRATANKAWPAFQLDTS